MDASLLSAFGGAIIGGLTSLLALFFAQRSQARVLGSTVIGEMLAGSGIAIFFIPVTFYLWSNSLRENMAVALVPAAVAKPR